MKAVVLVGGEATRLRPLTCNTPKAMVPVLNVPFLEYVIRHLKQHGVEETVLAQHHLAAPMEKYLGDGTRFGVRLHYVVEERPQGTAGAVKNAEKYLDGTFLVLNGDIFQDLDITRMMSLHRQRRAKVTIALTPVDNPTIYGVVETDDTHRVKKFIEKPGWDEINSNMINAGTYIIEPEILSWIPEGVKHSFERQLFPLLLEREEPVFAYSSDGYWMDTGTPEKYLQLHRDLLGGKSTWFTDQGEVIIGSQCAIHPAAEITGTVIIGDRCVIESGVRITGPMVIGSGCKILENTTIEDSVIWTDSRIGQCVRLSNSAVASNCRIEDNCRLEDVVLGDNVTVERDCILQPGTRIWPEETIKAPSGKKDL